MLRTGFIADVKAYISFTAADIELLMSLAKRHYDYKCKAAGECGGFIYGLNNQLIFARAQGTAQPVILDAWSFGECDRAAKICEYANYEKDQLVVTAASCIYMKMLDTCRAIEAERKRLNSQY
jgi:hypothetical protein